MNRGMKKWAPYKSLNEQADFINKMYYEKHKICISIDSRRNAFWNGGHAPYDAGFGDCGGCL